jgi:hypothetical protein
MRRLVFALIASLAVGGCAALAGAGLGGAGGFLVAGPPGAVVGAGAGAVKTWLELASDLENSQTLVVLEGRLQRRKFGEPIAGPHWPA